MCRELGDPHHRRCPSSRGHHRQVRDRARYAATTAAAATLPKPGTPPVAPAPIPGDVVAAADQVQSLLADTYEKWITHEDINWGDVEPHVRAVGAAVEKEASLITGFTPEDVASSHEERMRQFTEALTDAQFVRNAAESVTEETLARVRELQASGLDADDAMDALGDAMDDLDLADQNIQAVIRDTAVKVGMPEDTTLDELIRALDQADYPLVAGQLKALADAYKETLARCRPMGGEIEFQGAVPRRATTLFGQVAECFPSEWITASNDEEDLRITVTGDRAYYKHHARKGRRVPDVHEEIRPNGEPAPEGGKWVRENNDDTPEGMTRWVKPKVMVMQHPDWASGVDIAGEPPRGGRVAMKRTPSGDLVRVFVVQKTRIERYGDPYPELSIDRRRTVGQWQKEPGIASAIHETVHRFEEMYAPIGELEKAFHDRRTTLPDGSREDLVRLYEKGGEYARVDQYVDAYIGKEYAHASGEARSYEVMSVGMESLFAGRFGALAGLNGRAADPDMRAFILGVLATA